jgi:hypothetical protein
MFPTEIIKGLEVSIETGGNFVRINIVKGEERLALNYVEAKKLAEVINALTVKAKE